MTLDIFVYSEEPLALKELLGKARSLAGAAGGSVSTLLLGPEAGAADGPSAAGADVIYRIANVSPDEYDADTYTAALEQAARAAQANLILVGATKRGLELAPRLAERLDAPSAPWVVEVEPDASGALCLQAMLYTGLGLVKYRFSQYPVVATVAPGTFSAFAGDPRPAETIQLSFDVPAPRLEIMAYKEKPAAGSDIEHAPYVIDVGQGVAEKADLELVKRLAALLNAEVGCSRPVASDRDWFPEWLGLSGAKLHADLCITLGVSGAIQHVIGIRNSKTILAVNNDENAGIFSQADYGVVADLYEFVPVLIRQMQARSIRPA